MNAIWFIGVAFGIAISGSALLIVLSAQSTHAHIMNAIAFNRAAAGHADGARFAAARAADPARGQTDSTTIFSQLNEYYAANVMQGTTIFWATLGSMVIGFAFIFAGVVTAGTNATVAIVASAAGILTQFIAATFLVALRSTQQQSTVYAQTLVDLRLRDVRAADAAQATALGLRLLEELSQDSAETLANRTRAALAWGLIVGDTTAAAAPVSAPVVPPPVDGEDRRPFVARGETRTRSGTVMFDSGDMTDRAAPRPPDH